MQEMMQLHHEESCKFIFIIKCVYMLIFTKPEVSDTKIFSINAIEKV